MPPPFLVDPTDALEVVEEDQPLPQPPRVMLENGHAVDVASIAARVNAWGDELVTTFDHVCDEQGIDAATDVLYVVHLVPSVYVLPRLMRRDGLVGIAATCGLGACGNDVLDEYGTDDLVHADAYRLLGQLGAAEAAVAFDADAQFVFWTFVAAEFARFYRDATNAAEYAAQYHATAGGNELATIFDAADRASLDLHGEWHREHDEDGNDDTRRRPANLPAWAEVTPHSLRGFFTPERFASAVERISVPMHRECSTVNDEGVPSTNMLRLNQLFELQQCDLELAMEDAPLYPHAEIEDAEFTRHLLHGAPPIRLALQLRTQLLRDAERAFGPAVLAFAHAWWMTVVMAVVRVVMTNTDG